MNITSGIRSGYGEATRSIERGEVSSLTHFDCGISTRVHDGFDASMEGPFDFRCVPLEGTFFNTIASVVAAT